MKNYDDGQQICTSVYTVTNEAASPSAYGHEFYDNVQGGSVIHTIQDIIPAFGTRTYYLGDLGSIPDGYQGRLIIQSDQPFTVTLASCFFPPIVESWQLEISPVMKNYDDGQQICTSIYTVTNESATMADYAHDFYDDEQGGSVIHTFFDTISASNTITYNLADIGSIPDSYRGRAVISSDQPFTVTLTSCPIGSDTTPPAAITGLIATNGNASGTVTLTWLAPGDDGASGIASNYIVRYASSAITTEAEWAAATDVTGEPTPSLAGTIEQMTVSGLTPGQTYFFMVRTEDEVPNLGGLGNSPSAVATQIPWTLMFYLDGDNDLNDFMTSIMNQLESSADNSNVQVVVLWDRPGSNNSAYYQIQFDRDMNNLASYVTGINYWPQGEVNMGASLTLINFVNWAQTDFPAQHYALILVDHGTGVNGSMVDETPSHNLLEVSETGTALASITSNGTGKIDVLFFFACLMGMIEDSYQVRDYVDYYVASENLMWALTEPFGLYVSEVTDTTTPSELANLFSANYENSANQTGYQYTISAADISQLNSLVTATNNLSQLLSNQMSTISNQLTSIRSTVQRFDNVSPIGVINTQDQYIDLYHFAQLVETNIADANIKTAAQAVMTAVDNYIIDEHHQTQAGTLVGNSHGVSIFFPPTRSSFYNGTNLDFAGDTDWIGGMSISVTTQAVVDWGPMLVNYFEEADPGGTDNPTPPDPISMQLVSQAVYLPIIVK